MKFSSKPFLFGGFLLVALSSASALYLAACSSCEDEAAPREREPLSLIPDDAWIVATVQMGAVRASPAYKRLLRSGNPTEQYLGECDYDPLPDIDRLWIGAGDGVEKGRGAIIAFGRIDRDKVLDCFRAEHRRRGLSVEEEQLEGFTVYAAGPGRLHLAWLDSETVVIANRANAEKVLALEKGKGKSVRSNQTLFKLWERGAERRDVSIAVLPTEGAVKRVAKLLPNQYDALEKTTQALVALRFRKGLDALLSVRLKASDDATEQFAGRLERDVKRWSKNDWVIIAGIASHLKAINIEQAGPEVSASAHFTERQLKTLTRLAVDSIDEIMREGGDPEKAIRDRLRGDAGAGDAGADGAAETTGDGAPVVENRAPAKTETHAERERRGGVKLPNKAPAKAP